MSPLSDMFEQHIKEAMRLLREKQANDPDLKGVELDERDYAWVERRLREVVENGYGIIPLNAFHDALVFFMSEYMTYMVKRVQDPNYLKGVLDDLEDLVDEGDEKRDQ